MVNIVIKKIIRYTFVIIVLILCIYFASNQVDLSEIKIVLSSIHLIPVLLSIPLVLITNLIRAYRWKYLLKVLKPDIRTNNIFGSIMVGHLLNSFSIKFGELARPIVLAQREKMSKTSVLASAIIEGFADFLFLLLAFILFIFILFDELSKSLSIDIYSLFSQNYILLISVFVAFSAIIIFRKSLFNSIIKIVPDKFKQTANDKVELFKLGLSTAGSIKTIIILSLFTIVLWFSYATVVFVLFWAFDFHLIYNLNIFDALIIVIFAGIATALGFTPAAIGVYHLIVASIMISLYNIESSESYTFASLLHLVNLVVQAFAGVLYYIGFGTNFKNK